MAQTFLDARFSAPATGAITVSPDDNNLLTNAAGEVQVSRAIYIGGTGNMAVDTAAGETILFSGIPAGTIIPIRVIRVRSTNTTATLMVALY